MRKNFSIKSRLFKKIFLFAMVFIEAMALGAYPALAIHIPSASEIASDLEQRYHINTGSVRNFGESFNTSDNKTPAPQVSLYFSPSDPKMGEKIIATASPTYFNNESKFLYYTWYLRHPECEKTDDITDENRKCDLDEDGEIDVQDWKIEAARIIAGNGFDWNRALGIGSPNCDQGENPPLYCLDENKYRTASDDEDGYKAKPGGDDRSEMNPHCYIRDFESGTDYEIVESVAEHEAICEDLGDGITRTPVCVRTREETNATLDGSSFSCRNTPDEPTCVIKSSSTTEISCPSSDEVPMCIAADNINDEGVVINDLDQTDSCEDIVDDPITFPVGSGNPFDEVACQATNETLNDSIKFVCDDNDKRHLFAHSRSDSSKDSGDNSFGREDELFWHTNPESASTANNGNKDEANVVGLGQNNFSWNYAPGDKVGVAVEGVSSTPTKYDDSSLMIMWALPKNKCEISDTGTYSRSIKGYDVSIPIASISRNDEDSCIDGNCLNNCLEDNLIDPRGDSNSLNVSLTYLPDNPTNDASTENAGDELTVTASALNAKNKGLLKYQWEVYKSYDGINPESWGDPLLKSELPNAERTSGMGLSTFKFKLNFPTPVPQYLKVRVTVSESLDANSNNAGSSDIIIPLNSVANKIHVYSTLTNDDLTLKLLRDRERCDTGLEGVTCPVTKNEIVGLNIDLPEVIGDGAWTLDGESITPLSCPSQTICESGSTDCDCDPVTGDTADSVYFPVLKEIGETYSVEFSGTNYDGNKMALVKNFEVVDPSASIESTDETSCQPVLLGSYVDLDGQSWPDYSDASFEATTGSTISLRPKLNMPFTQEAQWFIDGEEATSLGAAVESDGALRFTANKEAGRTYSIAYTALYSQDPNVKKLLNSKFGVQLNEFFEKMIGASIEVSMVDSFSGSAAAQGTSKKILASIVTDVPAYISFLFKIVMTVALILFTSHILFSLFPKTNEN